MAKRVSFSGVRSIFRRDPQATSLEEQVYVALLRPGDTAFDVGANVGRVSSFIARVIGGSGSVIAFEPVWSSYIALCRAAATAGPDSAPVNPVPFGLAESGGLRQLNVPEGISELASLANGGEWQAAHSIRWSDTRLGMFLRLDEFLDLTGLAMPEFMKIDVEGAETFVIDGAGDRLSGSQRPLMLIELFAPWQRVMGLHPYDLLSRLGNAGYSFIFICPDGLVAHAPTRENPFPAAYVNGYNVIAYVPDLHNGRVASLERLMSGGGGPLLPMHPAPQPNVVV